MHLFMTVSGSWQSTARTTPDVASTCENIGLVLMQQGEVEKAKDKFEEAADIRRAKRSRRTSRPHEEVRETCCQLSIIF